MAEMAGGGAIPLDPTDPVTTDPLTGTNTLGTEGLDLTNAGTGRHHLLFDITGTGTGVQTAAQTSH